ncbi:IPExxxVDY family protein [Spongiivirga citrea]|uniref:IPExxxVDY family protein n=1 Tax=Spongiivirga citrea TaxID=1481457 RepID=A0A6M0CMH1_9FLAO|nr:IPExxxVDY family protein [Spongiivirga citrea]NER17204.1 IPExxxVDY family protein [Spongiivirga citrea]
MAVHKLFIEDFEASYSLFALHSPVEDYKLVYEMNNLLSSKFYRVRNDIDLIQQGVRFSRFEWNNENIDTIWNIVTNKVVVNAVSKPDQLSLFDGGDNTTIQYHLIPEQPKVDYFLKIEGDYNQFMVNQLLLKLKSIPHLETAYMLDHESLRSRSNLIFE